MNTKEYNIITLEDNIDYIETDCINYRNNTYYFLSDYNNPQNFCIRKLLFENNEEYIIGLDTKEEFDAVLTKFTEKYIN